MSHKEITDPMNDRELLIRIDGRTEQSAKDIAEIKLDLKDNYVRMSDFKPVRNVVFGTVKFILITVLGAILYLVIKH